MNIRSAFAQVIAEKIARPGAGPVNGESIIPTLQGAMQNIPTKAGDQVDVNFETVAKAIANNNMQEATAVKQKAPEAVETFGNQFVFGYGSARNHSFESFGDGIFSFQGGNMAQLDVTFMVDSSPGQDGIQWLVLDNTKLPKPAAQASQPAAPSAPVEDYEPAGWETQDPNVIKFFSDRMATEFGDQALLSINDERISSIAGYFLEGWESPGMVENIALGSLGSQWTAGKKNEFVLKSESASQKLSFDQATGKTKLVSFFKDSDMDSDFHSQTLTKDKAGSLTSYIPPT